MIEKIISGGQTGVDRAALDVAILLDIPYAGWCPKGRLDESGEMPSQYSLKETDSSDFSERTKLNIRDSDATLIIVPRWPVNVNDGTLLTLDEVKNKKKPYLVVDLSKEEKVSDILKWAQNNNVKTLNVAGPRESSFPGIYQKSFTVLKEILQL